MGKQILPNVAGRLGPTVPIINPDERPAGPNHRGIVAQRTRFDLAAVLHQAIRLDRRHRELASGMAPKILAPQKTILPLSAAVGEELQARAHDLRNHPNKPAMVSIWRGWRR